jgi:hypothetical protein
MKQFLIPFLVMAIGCGCESQPKKMNADKQREKARYLNEIAELLKQTRPTKDPRDILEQYMGADLMLPESWDL